MLAAVMLLGTAAPAFAQGWMYQPNSGDNWYCGEYGSEFECY